MIGSGIAFAEIAGDFDDNGLLDAADIDMLTAEIIVANNTGRFDLKFDVNCDGVVSDHDRTSWIHDRCRTWVGDSNLDGEFNSSDFVQVFIAGRYETDQEASWSEGDWNGYGLFNSADFVVAFVDGGYEQGPRPVAATSVPEPTNGALLIGLYLLTRLRGRRA